jgi:hypothetical protein
MINAKQVRALALSLPEVREEPHFDRASFRVRGKIFATIAPDEESGMLKLDLDAHEALLAAEPETFFSFGGFSRNGATGVRFARVKKQVFGELLGEAWRNVAPKKLGSASVRSRTKRRASRPG